MSNADVFRPRTKASVKEFDPHAERGSSQTVISDTPHKGKTQAVSNLNLRKNFPERVMLFEAIACRKGFKPVQ